MEYLKRVFKRASNGTLIRITFITTVAALPVNAIWGDNAPDQKIAWIIIGLAAVGLLFRLLFLAPYQLWAADQIKLRAFDDLLGDPLKDERKWLLTEAAGLLTSTKIVFHEWSVLDALQRENLNRDYHQKRARMTALADNFLHKEGIYQAAQDAINRCDISIFDAESGLPNHNALREAHEFTKILITQLSDSERK
jgi:hypothetical protein